MSDLQQFLGLHHSPWLPFNLALIPCEFYTQEWGAENANYNILKDGMVSLIHLPYGVVFNTYKEDNVPYQNPIQTLYYLGSIISSIYDI